MGKNEGKMAVRESPLLHYYRCPGSVYFNTLLFIIYLSAIETLICRRSSYLEVSLMGYRSTSFGFAQDTMHDF